MKNKSDIDEIKPEYVQGWLHSLQKEMSEVLKIAITDQSQ
jgi:ATP-dependent Lon protease